MRECTNVVGTIILATVLLACMNRESRAQDPCLKWTHLALAPANSPSPRYAPTAVYEAAKHRTLLFGGYRGSYPVGTWAWDGADWTWLTDSGPAGRNGHGMAYDSVRQRVVLFGGVPDPTNDTWEWDGTSWAQQPDAPPDLTPRVTVLAYDEARQQTILFGGEGGGSNLGDTWAWDGSQWLRLAESGPSPRHFQAMAYDAARQEIVLFGGTNSLSSWPTDEQVLGDTWVWNGSVWSQKVPPNSPTPRFSATMVFDPRKQTVVMFGGGGPLAQSGWTRCGSGMGTHGRRLRTDRIHRPPAIFMRWPTIPIGT